MKPNPPLRYAPEKPPAFDLSAFSTKLADADSNKQEMYDKSRKVQVELLQAKEAVQRNELQKELDGAKSLLLELIPAESCRKPRDYNLGYRVQDMVRLQSFVYFLEHGKLMSPSECQFATDEEYLAGAVMGLCQDLSRYGMGRATERDVSSVELARNLVQAIQNELLQFDFRNGPLRRKFDGCKYCLKSLETILYELSITGAAVDAGPPAKRTKIDSSVLLPGDEIAELRKRMEHRDDLRETLIKKCRDGQKAAKQSIFAMHRGDRSNAEKLLQRCEDCITKELIPIATEEPPLRTGGSLGGVMEEYAEGKLFHAWLFGKDGKFDEAGGESAAAAVSASGDLLLPEEFSVELLPEEYIGGLCDLTGEVGRYAVQRGTARDVATVKLALHTNSCVLNSMQMMEKLPRDTGKKMNALRMSVEKIERMLYEMSLSEATGRKVSTSAENGDKEEG